MLWPGIKKLGKELNLKRTDSEITGKVKNCFVRAYDGHNKKELELYVPEMDDDDKNNIVTKLESKKIKKYEWLSNGVRLTFVELVRPYSIKKIREILEELVNYFSNKYPAQSPSCQHCGQQNETDVYCVNNNASLLICNDCYRQMERDIQNENTENKNTEGNYLMGFIGAILFAIPGILATVLIFVFLDRLVAISALIYIILGIKGYKTFKGKISPVGAVIVIIAGLIMVALGVIAAYSVVIFRELEMINFSLLIYILKMPDVYKELIYNIALSYLVSCLYFVFQLNQMLKEWKNQKSIQKAREI